MVKELMHDPIFLSIKSIDANVNDINIADDLLETLIYHKATCVGMAANMIGVNKRIIAFLDSDGKKEIYTVMFNPQIVDKKEEYHTEESCLSLLGGPRKCVRYNKIKVKYHTLDMQVRFKTYVGWTAQIIQHEIDHCNGILI